MRTFKDITEQELIAKVDETFYFYLLSDIIESYKAEDMAIQEAIDIGVDSFEKRDQLTKDILTEVKATCEPNDTYDEFEDSLFVITEDNLY